MKRKPKYGRCRECRDLVRKCDACREQNTRNMVNSRIRRGLMPMAECFRCLSVHPMPRGRGERYCKLSAEWNGWPWPQAEEDAA